MLSSKISLKEVDVKDKRVLIRVDFNVPLANGQVKDSNRIQAAIPTLKYCLDNGCKSIVLLSHLGRPDGVAQEKFSLKPVVPVLEELLGKSVVFHNDCVGQTESLSNPEQGSVHLLENVRFHIEEEGKGVIDGQKVKADKEAVQKFCTELSSYGDIYVNDAFGTAHRAHASMVGVKLPIRAAGFLMEKELTSFASVIENPQRPVLAILGGAKVADKIQLINNLIDKVDLLIICGGMSYTFLKHLGKPIGKSLFDAEGAKIVPDLLEKAKAKGVELYFPEDYLVVNNISPDEAGEVVEVIPDDKMSVDNGPKTVEIFTKAINSAKTVIMNGPAGVFEIDAYANGTKAILNAMQDHTKNDGAVTVIGGGDSASAAKKFGITGFTLISTGGGASLELLEGKPMPGVEALSQRA